MRSIIICTVLLAALAPLPSFAGDCGDADGWYYTWAPHDNDGITLNDNCGTGWKCYEFHHPTNPASYLGASFELANPACDPEVTTCVVRLRVRYDFPALKAMTASGATGKPTPMIWWYHCANAGCQYHMQCGTPGFGGQINRDHSDSWVQRADLSCATAASLNQVMSVKATVCPGTFCGHSDSEITDLVFGGPALLQAMGCPEPPPPPLTSGCGNGDAGPGMCCGGPAGANDPAGQAPGFPLDDTNARMVYQAGGVGATGTPGEAAWRSTLGRYWSHEFAERIVLDPVTQDETHVWMLTKHALFIEFVDGNADGTYESVNPSDEQRTLTYSSGSGEWTLTSLDATVQRFNADGTWKSTTDRFGNATTASYSSGVLTLVEMPDGRSETFTYYQAPDPAEGKLHEVTQVGVGTSPPTRTWTYSWDADDLVRVDYPDGRAREFSYDSHPGYMTLMEIVGDDGTSRRVEAGWEYTAERRIHRTWKGKSSWGAPGTPSDTAVEQLEFSYDDPSQPTEVDVTDAFGNVTTYTIGYETGGTKPRLEAVAGDCPACGSPNRSYEYQTPSTVAGYSLRPSAMLESTGPCGNCGQTRTEYTYDTIGRLVQMDEAVGVTGLERSTEYAYDSAFPGLRSLERRPSMSGTGYRDTAWSYDSLNGVLDELTISGVETTYDSDGNGTADGTFSLTTEYTYNSAGNVATINPPSISGDPADTTTLAYDDTDWGDYRPSSRTDPEIGPTSFTYDAFGKRTTVTDPNDVTTETQYDELGRVVLLIQRVGTIGTDFDPGDPPQTGDLVTEYRYNTFGDLAMVVLPEGNVTVNHYDEAGRLERIEMNADDQPTTHNESILYVLHDGGQRIREELQQRVSGAWVPKSVTEYLYTSRCHVDKVIRDADASSPLVTEYAYDCNGNLENVWDANHPSSSQTAAPTTTYVYDELDRLTTVLQPWTGSADCRTSATNCTVTTYDYDVQDHLTSVTDAEGNETTYEYSDRDLLVEEDSPVSGVTTHRYNAHGMLWKTWNAASVTISRSYDGLDRLTLEDYPDVDTSYVYDDDLTCPSGEDFEIGRLSSVTRGTNVVEYCYDRFGRMTKDGALAYTYDKNSNVEVIDYPYGVTATYTFDHADRQASLSFDDGGGAQTVVSAASYLPFGPLSALTFGSGVASEARSFTGAYFPDEIGVTASSTTLLDWTFGTDAVGNITSIDDGTMANNDRAYGYKDVQYFLNEADGPWGGIDWVDSGVGYDRIGNRQREGRGGSADVYEYRKNASSGNSPQLASVTPFGSSAREYEYDQLGNLILIDDLSTSLRFELDYFDNGRMSQMARTHAKQPTRYVELTYDGRGYLTSAWQPQWDSPQHGDFARPTYSSAGVLHHVHREAQFFFVSTSDRYIFYLAGRPVATFSTGSSIPDTLSFVVTDHLGTPAMTLDDTGSLHWEGGFEPFGLDYAGAEAADVYFRLPGQWRDWAWGGAGVGSAFDAPLLYNVHRWYEPGTGRYTTPDPLLSMTLAPNAETQDPYRYAQSRPTALSDPLGLCALDPTMEHCLIFIFGEPVAGVKITPKPRPGQWAATSRANRIIPYTECEEFWADVSTVLEEYYHVLRQWNRGRMTRRSYGIAWARDGYDNKYEREAKTFVEQNLDDFEECLQCPGQTPASIGPGGVYSSGYPY